MHEQPESFLVSEEPENLSPQSGRKSESNARSLLFKELCCALILLCALIAVCLFVDAPYETTAPTSGERPAPWFFVALQKLLKEFPVWLGGLLFPLSVLAALAFLPFLRGRTPTNEASNRPSWETLGFLILSTLLVGLTVWGYVT
jgi:quinol-cytochrome oxidoreductase complex cytochrome b subunit